MQLDVRRRANRLSCSLIQCLDCCMLDNYRSIKVARSMRTKDRNGNDLFVGNVVYSRSLCAQLALEYVLDWTGLSIELAGAHCIA